MLRLLHSVAALSRSSSSIVGAASRMPRVQPLRCLTTLPQRCFHATTAPASSPVIQAALPSSPAAHTTSCRCYSSSPLPSSAASSRARSPNATQSARSFSTFEAVAPPSSSAVASPVEVGSQVAAVSTVVVSDPHARFIVLYTCKVCETRSAKSVSKQAYTAGVVLIRCDGCQKLHLFADHLKWFDDRAVDIEAIMREKGAEAKWTNSLELTQEQLDAVAKLQVEMQAKAAKSAELKKLQEEVDAKLQATSTAAASNPSGQPQKE